MKRRIKIAALISGSLLLLSILLLAWVIYTEAGLRFAVARLPEKMGKVTLRIDEVKGTIAGGFSAEYVDVDHELSRTQVWKGSARVNAPASAPRNSTKPLLRCVHAYPGWPASAAFSLSSTASSGSKPGRQ